MTENNNRVYRLYDYISVSIPHTPHAHRGLKHKLHKLLKNMQVCKISNSVISPGQLLYLVCYISFCYDPTTSIINYIYSVKMKKSIALTHMCD